jgi:hypothetical protein
MGIELVCSLIRKMNLVVCFITTLPLTICHVLDSTKVVDQADAKPLCPEGRSVTSSLLESQFSRGSSWKMHAVMREKLPHFSEALDGEAEAGR